MLYRVNLGTSGIQTHNLVVIGTDRIRMLLVNMSPQIVFKRKLQADPAELFVKINKDTHEVSTRKSK